MTVQPTSRRALLKGAAMLTAVPVSASAGIPVFAVVDEPEPVPSETPILRLFRQWEALIDACNDTPMTDEEWEALSPARYRLEDAIRDEPVTEVRDLAAKIIVLSGEGCWVLPNETTLECAALVGRDFAKMPRCLFEKAG